MKSILFVCLGNICRSPLAHGIAQEIINKEKNIECIVDSAGTSTWHSGESPCKNSIKIAKIHHIDISQQQSRTILKEDITHFQYAVAMDKQNKLDMENFGFKPVYLLGDFGGYKGADVPDPYFFDGFEGFEKVYTMVSTCVEDFMQKVKHECL